MRELSAAIDLLADEDPAELPKGRLAEQLVELHWQMARLQAEIARRTHLRVPADRDAAGAGWRPAGGAGEPE